MNTQSPKIGIVSGIGPLAGSDVLSKLFRNAAHMYGAAEDSDYPDLLLMNHGIKGVDNTATLSNNFEKEITDMAQQLETAGATIIGIACNTAHIYIDKIITKPETTLVNLIDTVSAVASEQKRHYLLLTSSTSKQQKLYHTYLKKYGVSFEETNSSQQHLLDQVIGLVMAHKLKEAGELLDQVLYGTPRHVDAIIAGCTELPIAIAQSKNTRRLPIIDSNDELAKALLTKYYGE